MNPLPPLTIPLDVPREVAWTQRAEARLSSLSRMRRAGGLYKLCGLIWAALVDKNHPFDDPEDLGEYLKTSEQVRVAGAAIVQARERAEDNEKNAAGSTPRPSPSSSSGSPQNSSGG